MARWSATSVRPVHALAAASVVVVAISTLSPFDFRIVGEAPAAELSRAFGTLGGTTDWVLNSVLFMPLGLVLAIMMGQGRWRGGWRTLALVLVVCAALSAAIEVAQAYLPARQSSLGDVLSNSLGGGIGYLIARAVGPSAFLAPLGQLSTRSLAIGFAGYFGLVLASIAFLQQQTALGSWDETYPLLVGNERTGNRAWTGHVLELSITDRAISRADVARTFETRSLFPAMADSVLASYSPNGTTEVPDRAGRLPDLYWHGASAYDADRGASLSADGWLESKSPVRALAASVASDSKFTLSAVVATSGAEQFGPARIVSLSIDPNHRNLTLGQEGTDLILRIRTGLTGKNGTRGEIAVPDVFDDTKLHQIVVVYDRPNLQIFVDTAENLRLLRLSPEVTLFGSLLSYNPQFRLGSAAIPLYKTLFYGAVFLPLGYLLALFVTKWNHRLSVRVSMVGGGLVLPAAAIEALLSFGAHREPSLENTVLGVAIMVVPILAVYFFPGRERERTVPR